MVVKWCTSFCCFCFVSANAIIYSSNKYLITKPFLAVHHLAVRFEDAGTAVAGFWWASISSSLAELWFYLKTPFVAQRKTCCLSLLACFFKQACLLGCCCALRKPGFWILTFCLLLGCFVSAAAARSTFCCVPCALAAALRLCSAFCCLAGCTIFLWHPYEQKSLHKCIYIGNDQAKS